MSPETLQILKRVRDVATQAYNPSAPLGNHVFNAVVQEVDRYLAPPQAQIAPTGPANAIWNGSQWVSGAIAPTPPVPQAPYPTGYVHGSYVPPPIPVQPEQLQGSPAPTIGAVSWQPSPNMPALPAPHVPSPITGPIMNYPGTMPVLPLTAAMTAAAQPSQPCAAAVQAAQAAPAGLQPVATPPQLEPPPLSAEAEAALAKMPPEVRAQVLAARQAAVRPANAAAAPVDPAAAQVAAARAAAAV